MPAWRRRRSSPMRARRRGGRRVVCSSGTSTPPSGLDSCSRRSRGSAQRFPRRCSCWRARPRRAMDVARSQRAGSEGEDVHPCSATWTRTDLWRLLAACRRRRQPAVADDGRDVGQRDPRALGSAARSSSATSAGSPSSRTTSSLKIPVDETRRGARRCPRAAPRRRGAPRPDERGRAASTSGGSTTSTSRRPLSGRARGSGGRPRRPRRRPRRGRTGRARCRDRAARSSARRGRPPGPRGRHWPVARSLWRESGPSIARSLAPWRSPPSLSSRRRALRARPPDRDALDHERRAHLRRAREERQRAGRALFREGPLEFRSLLYPVADRARLARRLDGDDLRHRQGDQRRPHDAAARPGLPLDEAPRPARCRAGRCPHACCSRPTSTPGCS